MNCRNAVCILVFAAVSVSLSMASVEPTWLTDAQKSFNAGEYDTALAAVSMARAQALDRAVSDKADNIEGWAFYKSGKATEAFAAFDRMASDPDHAFAVNGMFMKGKIKEEAGDPMAALDCYLALLAKHANSNSAPESRYRCGDLYLKATAESKKAMQQQFPTLSEALFWSAYECNGANKKADYVGSIVDQFEAAFPTSDWVDNVLMLKGNIEEAGGNLDAACGNYVKVVKQFGDSNVVDEANFRLGTAFLKLSRDEQAKWVASDGGVIRYAVYSAGWTNLNKKKEFADAEACFQFIFKNFPGEEYWDDSVMLLGRSQIKQSHYDEAIGTFRFLLNNSAYSNHWNEAQAEIVRVLIETERWQDVKQEAEKLYEYDHPRGKAYAVMSYVNACISLDQKQEAVDFLTLLIETYPEDPYIAYYQSRLSTLEGEGCCD